MFEFFCAIENDQQRALAEEIYTKYRHNMYRIAYAVLHDKAEAEDAVMDAVCKIVDNIGKFVDADEYKMRSLIVIIIRNTAINRYHYNKRRSSLSFEDCLETELGEETAPHETLENEEAYDGLMGKINSMDGIYKDVILLKYLYGYSNAEIAEFIGISESTVRVRLMRAKALLNKMMGGVIHDE